MFEQASWIGVSEDYGEICPTFFKEIKTESAVKNAVLSVTAIGVYEAHIDGVRVGEFFLAPGCTEYKTRLQYQNYDVTELLKENSTLEITVGKGWHRGRISKDRTDINTMPVAVIATLEIDLADGQTIEINTDSSWRVKKSNILFSDIYDGEIFDSTFVPDAPVPVKVLDELSKDRIIPQEGEYITEHAHIHPKELIITPKGERVIDFGQNFAGFLHIKVKAKRGTEINISFAEILDSDGNFYNENYRSAKCTYKFICSGNKDDYKPHFTFYGFRYIRLDSYPETVNLSDFEGIAVYSELKRTGYINTLNPKINKLVENTVWSQRANFIDVPTDCPQRDERMGWTGDAQVFVKTACFNYNVKKFFEKWVHDLTASVGEDCGVPMIVPNFWGGTMKSTAWGDAATVVPWTIYMMYGDKTVLKDNFATMRGWVDYMTNTTIEPNLWIVEEEQKQKQHFSDWLGLDAPYGSYRGSSDENLIASAFYAYSTAIVVKAGKVIGEDVSKYETLYENIVSAYKAKFTELKTQTEHVLTLFMGLTDNKKAVADSLVKLIRDNGNKLTTGFVGTPYLLHALSENGYSDVAYDLLLQEDFPSWLYEVNHGATTIWEHWDGIRDDGTIWSKDMNSYNHYAYGSVLDWIYTVAAGIKTSEEKAAFRSIEIAPHPDKRLGALDVKFRSIRGLVISKWTYEGDTVRYDISTPSNAHIIIGQNHYDVKPGSYVFFEKA